MITKEQIKKIMPYASTANIDKYLSHINDTCTKFSINTNLRKAHFLAQLAHESGSLKYNKELASGKVYDIGSLAKRLGNTPEADGDGQFYKGRGLIQLTGRANYLAFDKYLGGKYNLLSHPEEVEKPYLAVLVAGWFWNTKSLNKYADQDDMLKITKLINGGTNGLSDRIAFLKRAKETLK